MNHIHTRRLFAIARPIASLMLLSGLLVWPAQARDQIIAQTLELTYDEAQTVYLGNLARRANDVPPLRWNRQLTDAARWFSWDSVENRPAPYCGHQDTQGNWPDFRARTFGYKGGAGAENAFCGYVTPQQAIDGWMNSPGHRANLLDPNSREIGLGYYLRSSDGRGYVTQDFGHDPVYPPVIIENEAISTTTPSVGLYIYDRESGGGFAGMGPAAQMMVSNDACFMGAAWEPYTAEKAWTLTSGEGWHSVYVKTRDAISRTTTVSDTIYLGANVPLNELGAAQMSATQSQVTLVNLNGGALPQMQFSLGWLADDTFGTFGLLWGSGAPVSNAAAWGGTAFRLSYTSTMESSAWVWTTEFVRDVPLVAYVRLKVSDNTSSNEVARFSATGGGTLSLKGADFAAANQYQEFALPFTFPSTETFLIFQFWRSGLADVYVDAVSIFTAPRPASSTVTWTVPGGNYRGQGVWVRYTNGSNQFSPFLEASAFLPSLSVSPSALTFLAFQNQAPPPPATLGVSKNCGSFGWQAQSHAAWLQAQPAGDSIQVSVNHTGLVTGTYTGTLTVSAMGVSGVSPVTATVRLIVSEQLYPVYLPTVIK